MLTPDYLVLGHISRDITASGTRLGGSAAYAALTAKALGLRAAMVTAYGQDVDLTVFDGIEIASLGSPHTTTFSLVENADGRRLRIRARALPIQPIQIPAAWERTPLVHFAPIAQEIDPALMNHFAGRFVGVTPQGWLRGWNALGNVLPANWPDAAVVLPRATATVLSIEDLGRDETRIPALTALARLLVVTRGADGATVYWREQQRHFPAPQVAVVDTTGAGDIFAAAFFVRLYHTRDPWEAARFAVALASASVTRQGLASVPTADEIRQALARA